ncbi:MAG: type I methionyl aminopeptidase [Candidatus Omnitrophota bacterium]
MIELKTSEQVEKIMRASEVVVSVLSSLKKEAVPGVKTKVLDKIAKDIIESKGAKPAFLGYRGFPNSICTSINEEIVHGIPGERVLKQGDILSIDVGAELEGFFSDAAVTVAIGKIPQETQKLIEISKEALYRAIDSAKPGNRISDISCSIQEYVESNGFSVIREFVGHGIGSQLHEDPQIPNFGQRGVGPRIKKGMVFAIEPMVSAGSWEAEILSDGWTVATKDRSITAHFEHTVAVSEDGVEILTDGII